MVDKSIRYNVLKNIFLLHLLSNKSYFLRDIFILYQIFFFFFINLHAIYLFIYSVIHLFFIYSFIYLFIYLLHVVVPAQRSWMVEAIFLDFINFFP